MNYTLRLLKIDDITTKMKLKYSCLLNSY